MADNVATLGLDFTSAKTESKIDSLIKKFDVMREKCGSTQKALDSVFGGSFHAKISNATRMMGKFNRSIAATGDLSTKGKGALSAIPKAINSMNGKGGTASADLSGLVNQMNKVPPAANRVSRSVAVANQEFIKAPPALRSFNSSLSMTEQRALGVADGLFRAFGPLAVINYLKNATAHSIDFGTQIAYITTLANEFNPGKLSSGLMNFDSLLGSASKNANALYYSYSSGVRGSEKELAGFTKTMSELALTIRSGVVPTVDAATSAMNAYALSAKNATEISDLFFSIVKYGKASGSQLAVGIGQAIPTAAALHLSLNELGASISSLTKVQKTRIAITGFNNMLNKMLKPTKESRQATKQFGIELGITAVRAKGFANIMQEIHDKVGDNAEALARIFPDIRGQRAALHLLGNGWQDFQQQLTNFENKAGSAATAMAVLRNDVNVQLGAIPTTLNKIGQQTGTLVTDILTLGGALTPVIASFNNMDDSTQKMLGTITLMAGGYMLLKTAMGITQAMKAKAVANTLKQNLALVEESELRAISTIEANKQAIAEGKLALAKDKNAVATMKSKNAELQTRLRETNLRADYAQAVQAEINDTNRSIRTKLAEIKTREQNINIKAMEIDQERSAISSRSAAARADAMAVASKGGLVSSSKQLLATLVAEKEAERNLALQRQNNIFKHQALNKQYHLETIALKEGTLAEKMQNKAKERSITLGQKQKALKHTRTLEAGGVISQKDFSATFLGAQANKTLTQSIIEKTNAEKNSALSASLFATKQRKAALVSGDMAEATKQAGIAQTQYAKYMNLSQVSTRIATLANKQKMFTQRAALATTKSSVLWNKLLAKSCGRIAAGYGHIGIAAHKTTLKVSALGKSMLWIAALGAVMKIVSHFNDMYLKSANAVQKASEKNVALAGKQVDSAKKYSSAVKEKINKGTALAESLYKLSKYENINADTQDLTRSAIKRLKEQYGELGVVYDENAKKLIVQNDLLSKIQKKNEAMAAAAEAREKQALQTAIKIQQERLKLLNKEIDERNAFWGGFWYRLSSGKTGDTIVDEYSGKIDEAHVKLIEFQDKLRKFKGNTKEGEKLKQQIKQSEKITALQEKLQEAKKKAVFDKFNDPQKISALNSDISSIEERIIKIQQSSALGIQPDKGSASWREQIVQAELDIFNKKQEIFKINERILKQNKSMLKNIDSFQFDAKMKNADIFGGEQKLLNDRLEYFKKQVKTSLRSGDFKAAFDAEKNAYAIQQRKINLQNKLAEAERRANDSTLKMIQSMDKFKASTTAMVFASSVQAVKLQSRRFDKLPTFNPITSAQNKLNEEQKKLALSATSVSGALEVLRGKITALSGAVSGKSSFNTNNSSRPSIKNGRFPELPTRSGSQTTSSKEIRKITAQSNKSLENVMKDIKNELSRHTSILSKIAKKSGIKIESVSI